ncbi:MAG: 3-keto-5-aminohexanoate cleavage protein [Halofilum sp. (in: g-proteobacteria)]|nr:3-keto-5-aminohexanoate cleavage protein [Halofilum sp. (in: g-proteobacteria)]
MNTDVIISCPVTGAGDTVNRHPAIPVTPKEIADAAIEAAQAGAAIAHIHVRDPQSGQHSHDVELFREVAERVRSSDTDVVHQPRPPAAAATSSPGERRPRASSRPGTDLVARPSSATRRVGELHPEICTLDCGSYNFADGNGDRTSRHRPNWARRQARLIQDAGVKAEIECFDLGHVRLGRQLVEEGLVDGDPLFQLCLGIPWAPRPDTVDAWPTQCATGCRQRPLGRHSASAAWQMPMVAQAMLLGGHVRVGLEDNLYLSKGVHGSNGQLVEKARGIIEGLGGRAMTPAQARDHLGLRKPGS